jgi:hypothetical protein
MLRADGLDLVPPSTALIRRSTLSSIGGFQYVPDLCVTDFPTFVTLSRVGKFFYTPDIIGYRRRHLGSATYSNFTRILTHAHRYVGHFIGDNALFLTVAEREAIDRSWSVPRPSLEFTAGRLELLNGRWKAARTHFVRALRPSDPRFFFSSLAGWVLSWFQCNLEEIVSLAGIAKVEATPSTPTAAAQAKRH